MGKDYGCSPLSLAVIRRDLSTMKRILSQHCSLDGIHGDPHSPLSFSVGWPEGMRYLLEAGADPSTAIHPAVFFGDEEAVEILLEYDCAIYRDYTVQYPVQSAWHSPFEGDARRAPVDSVLEYSLWSYLYSNGWDRCPKISNMPSIRKRIIDYIAESRKKLGELARSKLPRSEWGKLGCDGDVVVDQTAASIVKRLQQLGVAITRRMLSGRYKTVYHMRYLDSATAEFLYEAGFQDFDVEDEHGCTPLLLCCTGMLHKESLDSGDPLPSWYLEHGVSLHTPVSIGKTTHLHLLARRYRYYLRRYHPSNENFPRLAETFRHLASLVNLTSPDDCRCLCSSLGCLPSTILLKAQSIRKNNTKPLDWDSKYVYLHALFLGNIPHEQLRQIHAAAARLEIFERLDMTHTCCFGVLSRNNGDSIIEDHEDIRDEEGFLALHLEEWMEVYHHLEEIFSKDFSLFWEAWWDALSKFMPERPWYKVPAEGEKAYWAQDSSYDYPGITEYGPDRVQVHTEMEFLMEQLYKRQNDWMEFAHIECDVLAPSPEARKDSMFSV